MFALGGDPTEMTTVIQQYDIGSALSSRNSSSATSHSTANDEHRFHAELGNGRSAK